MWPGFLLLACRVDGPADPTGPLHPELTTPVIRSLVLGCDVDAEEWQLDVEASSWSAGGELWFTRDGDYVEVHAVRSRSAAPDGSSDLLRLELAIAADWRDASAGSVTAFRCSDAPAAIFLLHDLEGEVVDCRVLDEAGAFEAVQDAPVCDPVED